MKLNFGYWNREEIVEVPEKNLLAVLTAGVPMHRSLKLAHALLCVSVCCSTVLLRQHSCVDVFWGVVLAAVIWPLTGRWLQDVYGPRPQRRPLLRS